MSVLAAPAAALAWLGRQGTRAVAALVFVAIVAPPLDAVLKPFVSEAVFALLCIAFLRVEPEALRGYVRRPGVVLAATAWTMLVVPVLFGVAGLLSGVDRRSPDLFLALMLQGAASPMMAAPAFAAMMGFDSTLVLVTLLASSALTSFTAPLFAYAFVGRALTLSPVSLGVRLFVIVAGAALLAVAIRRVVGAAAIRRHDPEIAGLNILVAFVFVAAVMEHVAARFVAAPLALVGLAGLAFVVYFAVLGVTTLVFAAAGRERAFIVGLTACQRNMGLMVGATAGVLPDLAWLYFAMSQFPIYLSPHLLKSLAHRLGADRTPPTSASCGARSGRQDRLRVPYGPGYREEDRRP